MRNTKDKPNDNNEYSKDRDQTRFLWMAFGLAVITMVGLFALEFFHPTETPLFFSSEIVHILANGIFLGFFGLGAYIYGKNVGANEALAKMAGGGTGNQAKPKQDETQQSRQGHTKQGDENA